jgi:hypothetical protein
VLPSPEGAAPRLQRRGPGPEAAPRQSRPPQAVTPMGGTLRRSESALARHVQAGQRGRRRTHQRLEHPTATSLLPLERISKLCFVIYIPNTPVGCTDVNSFELIKLKGNLDFPRKPSHPRGLLWGAPPRLNLSLGQIQAGREWPSGKDTRVRDSLCLREDTALLPRL